MKMHKFWLLITLLIAMSLVVVACGADEEEATAVPEPEEEAAPVEEPADDKAIKEKNGNNRKNK